MSATVLNPAYSVAMLDWLACAVAGAEEPAARAARGLDGGLAERIAAAGTAGHVLDFDDTYLPGLAHLSAPTAPVALLLGAEREASVGEALAAYAAGFEATGGLSAANHPAIRERGWHPTAVCGVAGAAVAAARLLELDREATEAAVRLALLRAGGLQGAFGSDGKALQVGQAAAAGTTAAQLAAAGAGAGAEVVTGFEQAFGARWPADLLDRADGEAAVVENWIKAYPCCLQTHSAIEAADRVRAQRGVPDGTIVAVVHPVSRLTAFRDDVRDGLEAKFSIPYLVAYTLLYGPPDVASFRSVDPDARVLAERVAVRTDPGLLESEALIELGGTVLARVGAALGSPEQPMGRAALRSKVHSLAGERLDGVLDDPRRPVAEVIEAAGLR
ncbi:MAG: MmgE/PrpD family protein [Actinobacteria bacterium]|nr:MAG: MmgE/PrpD family protein [Actinomycetota bacterium]